MYLKTRIEEFFAKAPEQYGEEHFRDFDEFKAALNELWQARTFRVCRGLGLGRCARV